MSCHVFRLRREHSQKRDKPLEKMTPYQIRHLPFTALVQGVYSSRENGEFYEGGTQEGDTRGYSVSRWCQLFCLSAATLVIVLLYVPIK